ncbi:uncharacterized protein [Elaeis guineensis]|uniref:uncharacterized protein n=1 Tax=Elaeis guineensis var. tenera TaxID=51953 RepID=UPI003C6CD547
MDVDGGGGLDRQVELDGICVSEMLALIPIKNDVLAAIQEVFAGAVMPNEWKRTHIVLIPKVNSPKEVKHYRPLWHPLQFVAKVLVKRLDQLMPYMFSSKQGAFILGRNILDNIMIAQEIFHSMARASKRNSLMVIKADMEKAYDKVY